MKRTFSTDTGAIAKVRNRDRRFLTIVVILGLIFGPTASAIAQKKPATTPVEDLTGKSIRHSQRPGFELPPGINIDDGLSESEAVAIALWNNATLHTDLGTLGLARADLREAGLLRNPLINLVFPVGPYPQFEAALSFPLEVFWQRKKRVEAASLEVTRVAASLEQNALNLIRDVRIAYADWLLAAERTRLATEAVDVRKEMVRLTNVRLRVGDVSGIEATTMRLDESIALEQATRFAREIAVARDRLRFLLGMTGQAQQPDELYTNLKPIPGTQTSSVVAASRPEPSLDDLFKTAYQSRPDLRAAALAIEAAAKRAKWEHSRMGTLAGLLNIKQGAGVPFAVRPGFILDAPIFNRNQGGIARADADVERATWQYVAVRQRISAEVQESLNLYRQSRAAIDLWRANTIPPALENASLAQASYSRGDQSYLFVLDSARRMTEVRQREAELLAEVIRAAINLDRSIGQRHNGGSDAKP